MPRNASTPTHSRPVARLPQTIALALVALACVGLSACASSRRGPTSAEAAQRRAYLKQRAGLLALVGCAHRHGIPLPQPTPQNTLNTSGVNLKIHNRQALLYACYQKTIQKAGQEHEAELAREAHGRSAEAAQAKAEKAAQFAAEREQLIAVVRCARRHGLHLPEPDSHNNVDTRGFHIQSPHNKALMSACLRQAVSQAASAQQGQQQQQEQEQRQGPRRLGE